MGGKGGPTLRGGSAWGGVGKKEGGTDLLQAETPTFHSINFLRGAFMKEAVDYGNLKYVKVKGFNPESARNSRGLEIYEKNGGAIQWIGWVGEKLGRSRNIGF